MVCVSTLDWVDFQIKLGGVKGLSLKSGMECISSDAVFVKLAL